jgi:squalene synthase HpnD
MTLEAVAENTNYGTTASGSSFYAAMRILPREQREAMFQIYSFCRKVDDIADSDGPRGERLAALQQWRDDIDALYQGDPPPRLRDYVTSVKKFDLQRADFLAIVDGMEMDVPQDIRAPDLATLDLYCDRVASAVGRLSVRVFGLPTDDGIALAHHLGRALQLTNILRDIDEDAAIGRLYLPREGLRPWLPGRARISKTPMKSWRAIRAAWCARHGSCQSIIGRSWNCSSRGDFRRRGLRSVSTSLPGLPSCCATPSSDAKDRPYHRRRNLGPCRSRAARQRGLPPLSPRGDAAGGRPLPLLFR